MCDQDNWNSVLIVSTDLELVKYFGIYSHKTGNGYVYGPVSIIVGSERMLYFSDYGNHRIQVLIL